MVKANILETTKKLIKGEKPTKKEYEQSKRELYGNPPTDNIFCNISALNFKELEKTFSGVNIKKIVENKVAYYRKNPFQKRIKRIWIPEIKEHLELVNEEFEEEEEKREVIIENVREEEDFTYLDEKGKEKVSIPKVAMYLIQNHSFKTIFGKKEETIYYYDNGIYNLRGKEIIKTKVEDLLDYKCNTNIVREVLEKIKRRTSINPIEFDKVPIEYLCLENGVLNITTKELQEDNPKFYFKSRIPIIYNQKQDCPTIKKFIGEICYPEDVPIIQEWFGFCLFRKYFIKKGIILFGDKNTGKTVLMNLLIKFIGEMNVSGISLQRIASKDKFALASLNNKYVNAYDDLSANDLNDAGGFKIATGGGYVTAEHKFGDSFQFMTFAKNIFATNKIPNVKEINDDAYYERWIPIPLDNQIPDKEQDKFILEKLTTKEELSGLLNWALEGLDRLLKNNKFSYNKNSEEIKMLMLRQNNPLVAFAEEVLKQEDGNRISKDQMYQVYSKWCEMKKVPRLSKTQLGRNLEKYAYYLIAKHDKERYWLNVKMGGDLDIFDTF